MLFLPADRTEPTTSANDLDRPHVLLEEPARVEAAAAISTRRVRSWVEEREEDRGREEQGTRTLEASHVTTRTRT